MNSKLLKKGLVIYVIAGSMLLPGLSATVFAKSSIGECCNEKVETAVEEYQKKFTHSYQGVAYASMGGFAHIRNGPSVKSDWVGQAKEGTRVEVLKTIGDWSEVQSGEVKGFMETKFLTPEEDPSLEEKDYSDTVVRVQVPVLNVRQGTGTDTDIIDQITENTTHHVAGNEQDGWIPVQVDDRLGFVAARYVELEEQYMYAIPKEETETKNAQAEGDTAESNAGDISIEESDSKETGSESDQGATSNGQAVIDYACQFIGNPYVWGGTDLENGADCSGFVQSVYRHFGVELPRTSGEQRSAGREVSYEEAQPGDIICYDGHVGLYMGDDKIVNAIGRNYGIDISSATHKKILSVRRVL